MSAADPMPSPAVALDDDDRQLIDLAARFSRSFLRTLDGGGRGGYARLQVLERLHCQGAQKMGMLAEALGLSARNLTAVADGLEAEGLVRRTAHPTDRRATNLEITAAGMDAAEAALAPRFAEAASIFSELPASARARFRKALATLVDTLEQGCPDADCESA